MPGWHLIGIDWTNAGLTLRYPHEFTAASGRCVGCQTASAKPACRPQAGCYGPPTPVGVGVRFRADPTENGSVVDASGRPVHGKVCNPPVFRTDNLGIPQALIRLPSRPWKARDVPAPRALEDGDLRASRIAVVAGLGRWSRRSLDRGHPAGSTLLGRPALSRARRPDSATATVPPRPAAGLCARHSRRSGHG